jgi:two-component system NarL family sensor kinase
VHRVPFPALAGEATASSERIVAWLRVPAIGLIALGETLAHPNTDQEGFYITLGLYTAWSAATLVFVHLRAADERVALVTTGVDIAAISVLAVLSGGAFSEARLAFFLVPVTVAFRFRPAVTGAAVVVTTGAYVIQAFAHPAAHRPDAVRFIVTQAGFLAWVGLACVLLSGLLGARTQEAARLAGARSRLLTDTLEAEQRARRTLAESLHDHAIQNLLYARHELEDLSGRTDDSAASRAEDAIVDTVAELREAVFELHPYVLDEAGLEAALRSIAQRAAARARLALTLDLRYDGAYGNEQLVFSAARELLANVVQHAHASSLAVRLFRDDGELVLVVEDDGRGFPTAQLSERVAEGHIGLASQRYRVEAAGGTLLVGSRPGTGTRVEIRLPGHARFEG